jgi:hypothetical protein
MSLSVVAIFAVCLSIAGGVLPLRASTIVGGFTVIDTFKFVEDRQSNDAGVGIGTADLVGIDVTPVGCQANCTGPATTVRATQGAFAVPVPYLFSPAVPNEFAAAVHGTFPTGAWTLSLSNQSVNAGAIATIQTAPLQTSTAPPFVSGVNLVQNGLTPTINWSLPETPATNETVYIRDRSIRTPNGVPIVYESPSLPGTTTGFTVPFGLLVDNHQYTFSVQQDVRSSGVLVARSVAFVDFVQNNSLPPGTVLQLPVVVINGNSPIYDFNFPIGPGQIYYLDPSVTAGYLYQTGAGDPLFASVSLPSLGAGISYKLCLPQVSGFACNTALAPDQTYDFSGSGVSSFEVLVDGANLDPLAGLPFATAVSFEGGGTLPEA